MITFADDTTMEGIIRNNDETAYRLEINELERWCSNNNLELNVGKTKEMVIDFRKIKSNDITPVIINGVDVEQVKFFKFLGLTLSDDLSWEEHCTIVARKAQQRLYFLRQLKKFRASKELLLQFYRATVESVLTFSISTWFCSSSQEDKDRLEKVVTTARKIVGCDLPSLQSLYNERATKRALKISADPVHPANSLFKSMRSGRLREIKTRTARFHDSFFPSAIRLINKCYNCRKDS